MSGSLSHGERAANWVRDMSSQLRPWASPAVSSSEYSGEVTLEWWKNKRELGVYFTTDGDMLLKVWGTDIDCEMEELPLTTKNARAAWKWLQG